MSAKAGAFTGGRKSCSLVHRVRFWTSIPNAGLDKLGRPSTGAPDGAPVRMTLGNGYDYFGAGMPGVHVAHGFGGLV
jgi:hypothetical protein